jgi:preprotein translocase subunit SecD
MPRLVILIIVMSLVTHLYAQEVQSEKQRLEAEQKWRDSDEGKRALAPITAGNTRLQIRLVLTDEKEEGDDMPDPIAPQGPKLRVSKQVALNEKAVASAEKSPSADGAEQLSVKLTEIGGRQMEWITSHNLNRKLAIVFDGKVLSAPTIRSTIRSALVIRPGIKEFAAGEADRLIDALKSASREK